MAQDYPTNNESRFFEKETISLVENVAKIGFWECNLKTGEYRGAGIARDILDRTGSPTPHIEDVVNLTHPDDREKVANLHRLHSAGKGYVAEFRFLFDKHCLHVQTASEIIRDKQGKPIRAVGFMQDITEKKLEEQAREKSEQRYRTLFHDACYAIWVMHPDGTFFECNHKTLEIYKAGEEEKLLEHTFASLAPTEQSEGVPSHEKAEELIQNALETDHNEFQWLAKDLEGRVFWTHVSLTKLHSDDQEQLQVILRDIDQEKKSQLELIESEEKYKFFFENTFYGVAILTAEMEYIDCNMQNLKFFGLDSKEQILGKNPVDFSPEYQPDGSRSKEKAPEIIRKTLEQGRCDFDWLHQKIDGTEFWSHVSLDKVYIGGQKCILALIQDIDEAKRAQEQLKKNELRQKFVIKYAGLNIWSWDARTDLFAFSPDCTPPAITDFGSKSFTLDEFMERCHPEDQEKTLEAWDKITSGRSSAVEIEYRLQSPEGNWLWVQVNAMILERDQDGKTLTAIGCNQDIDKKKRAQELIKESEAKYRNLFENSYFAICILSADGHVVDYNSRMPELFHVDNEESLLNITPGDVSPTYQPDGKRSDEKTKEYIETVLEKGDCDFQWYHKRFDGTEFWTHVWLTKISIGGEDFIQTIIQDIDEAKRAQEQLKENEIRQKFILKNTGLDMWGWDARTEMFSFMDDSISPALKDIKHRSFPLEEFIDRYHPDDVQNTMKVWADIISGKVPTAKAEYRMRAPDGRWYWMLSHAMTLEYDENGKPLVILGCNKDIDQEKHAEELLKESEAKYRNLFENSYFALGIITTDDGRLVDCNARMPELFRADSKEAILNILPEDISPTYQPDGRLSTEKAQEHLDTALKTGSCDFDWYHKRFDGTEFWSRESLTKITIGGKVYIQVIAQDIDEAKRTQEMLKESESKYRNLFENSFFAVCLYTPDGHLVDCNARMPELFRVEDKTPLLNTTPLDISPPYQAGEGPTVEKAKEYIATALEKGEFDFDWHLKRPDGTEFWSHVCLTKISIGNQDFLQTIIQDIDEAKRVEQRLKESEIRHKFIIQSTGLNMWVWDAHTKRFAFTDGCNLTPLADLENRTFTVDEFMEHFHPDDHKPALKIWKELTEGKMPTGEVEYRLLTPGGNWLWVQANAIIIEYDPHGKPITILGYHQDIDKKKRAKAMLEESERRKEFVIKFAGLLTWIWNLKTGQIIHISEGHPLAKHYPQGEIHIEEMGAHVHPDDVEAFREKAEGLVAETIAYPELEYRYQNPEGGWTWIKSAGMIVERDEEGKPQIAVGFHQDVTNQKLYEQELLTAKQITEEANRAKSQFLANMSHEIRTPMTAILGYLDLLCDSSVTSGERDEYVEIMRRNGVHLLDLINDILDLSKIESGQIDINPNYVKLIQIIDCVVGPLESLAGEKKITLQVDYLSKIPEKIWTDARLLRQILWNIVGNAVKFTDEGQVRVEIEYCVSSKQDPNADDKEKRLLKIRVQDTGCGIPPQRLSSIFDPFVQADPTATRKFGGTGLGLAIARRQVEILHGTIRAWNNLAGGATFEIVFPLEHTENIALIQSEKVLPISPPSGEEKPLLPVSLTGTNLLLAEDGLDNQRLIGTVLRKAGATVDIANNGQEAIEMIQAIAPKEYDVILMDMQMPILDGYTATSRLREMKVKTPIIALTAHAMSDDRKKCLESGCDGYCTKPIRPQELIRMISRYIGSKLS